METSQYTFACFCKHKKKKKHFTNVIQFTIDVKQFTILEETQ